MTNGSELALAFVAKRAHARGTPRANPRGRGLEGFLRMAEEVDAKVVELWDGWLADLDDHGLAALRNRPRPERVAAAYARAGEICEADVETNRRIGEHGVRIIEEIAATVSRAQIAAGPPTMWRYDMFLPSPDERVDIGAGYTRLVEAPRLAAELGIKKLWLKSDAPNPTQL